MFLRVRCHGIIRSLKCRHLIIIRKSKVPLKEAGWEDHDGDGYLDKDGKKFSFEIKTNQGNKIREDLAVVVQQTIKRSGNRG